MTKARASIHQPFSRPVCVFFLQVSVILKVTQRLIDLTARFSQSEVVSLSNTSKSKKKKKKRTRLKKFFKETGEEGPSINCSGFDT